MTNNGKIYVLYHANCTDGTGAKYAAWKKLGNSAEYIAVNYGQPVPEMESGSRIFILDFSYPKNVLEQLQNVHREVVVLDHHKTAEEALRGCKGCTFDMNRSGAVMAWEYFHPGIPVPKLLLNVQDRDLWKWEMYDTAQTHAGLQLVKGSMAEWDKAATHDEYHLHLITKGQALIEKQELVIESAVKHKVKIIDFMGHKVGITNQTDYASEIGNAICQNKDLNVNFAFVYCITKEDDVLVSLRSEGDMDVSEIAKKFGGGGHKNASGCKIGLETLAKILKGNI
jgi:oligoribonuclease NrnB/cAMP/cGMP phosphodiesterase (DHH superfamily)